MGHDLIVPRDAFFRSVRKKLGKSIQTRGVFGTVRLSAQLFLRTLANLSPGRRAQAKREREEDEDFDRRYGVDTSGVIPLSNLSVSGNNWMFGGAYQALAGRVDFDEILKDLDVPYQDVVFIDIGSGKGRAVLMASMLPFRAVVGVEFAEELHRVAEDNIRRWPADIRQCGRIELVCGDAAAYTFPDGPLVLFLYNPFGRPVMERFIDNLSADLRARPRRFVILYFTPNHSDLWERVPLWKKVKVKPGVHVFDTAGVGT